MVGRRHARRVLRESVPRRPVAEPPSFDASKVYGISGFSVADYFATPPGGGEVGAVTGFLAAVLCSVSSQAVASKTRPLIERLVDAPAAGYTMSTKTTNATASSSIASDAPALVTSGAYTIAASLVGKLMLFMVQHSGGQAHENRFFAGTTTASRTAMTGYTPAANAPTYLGAGVRSGSVVAADGLVIYEAATFAGAPYLADVTDWANLVRTVGDLSPVMNRATKTHYWSLKVELAKDGVAVDDGAPVPAALPDIVTGQAAHAFERQGSALIVRVGDPVWGYVAGADEVPAPVKRR